MLAAEDILAVLDTQAVVDIPVAEVTLVAKAIGVQWVTLVAKAIGVQ